MNRRRTFAATALLVTAGAVPALGAETPALLVAGSSVTVETTSSGTLDLVLPDPATVSTDVADSGVVFRGEGRLLGVWLTAQDEGGDHLASYRLPDFAGGDHVVQGSSATTCRTAPDGRLPLAQECVADGSDVVLREGRYRMTVLTDGQPVSVTVHLDGLAGAPTTTGVRTPLASAQKDLPRRESVGRELVTYGTSTDIGAPARTFVVATATGSPEAALSAASVCQRSGEAEAPPLGYAPPCTGGSSGSYGYASGLGGQGLGGGTAFGSSDETEVAGPIGLGGSFASTDGVTFGQALGVWLARP